MGLTSKKKWRMGGWFSEGEGGNQSPILWSDDFVSPIKFINSILSLVKKKLVEQIDLQRRRWEPKAMMVVCGSSCITLNAILSNIAKPYIDLIASNPIKQHPVVDNRHTWSRRCYHSQNFRHHCCTRSYLVGCQFSLVNQKNNFFVIIYYYYYYYWQYLLITIEK